MRFAGEEGLQRLSGRGRKVRQAALAQLDRQVAAAGDFDRVLQGLGQIGEEVGHLGRAS
jgi:hypothetical protein